MSDDSLETLLGVGARQAAFAPNSRYHQIETATLTTPGGDEVAYLQRRFVPPPEQFTPVQEHLVARGDRLDRLAAAYLGDPEQFWRLCDANGAIRPGALTEEPGSTLVVALPRELEGT